MNSRELKEHLGKVIDIIDTVQKVTDKIDRALRILHPTNAPDDYVSLSGKLQEAKKTLWTLRFQDYTGLDKLDWRWTDEQIARAKAAYDADPTHSVIKSDDSYSTWTEYIYWDALPTLDKNEYLREYFKETKDV